MNRPVSDDRYDGSTQEPLKDEDQTTDDLPELNDDPDFELNLRSAQDGCRIAQGKILDSLQAFLLLVARSRLRSSETCFVSPSDLVQGCNLTAISAFPEFRGTTKQELRAWLTSIMLNSLIDNRRSCQRTRRSEVDPIAWNLMPQSSCHETPTPSDIFLRDERERRLRQLLSTLSDRQREVVYLRQYENLTFPEIAMRIGCSSNAACHIWMRALDELSKKVEAGSEW